MDVGFNLRRMANASAWRLMPNRWDFVAFPLIICLIALAAIGFHETMAPISTLTTQVISLDPANLPEYALRTTLRMLAAMLASLVFTLVYGTLAAKSRRAGMVLIPILDVLQSVPVLGYISFTVTFFLALFPKRVLGAELAAIFAIFTSQAWNMTFSFYQSLRTVPRDLDEVSRGFHLTGWQRFWKLEVPFSMPGLIWNMMMSMSGGWFFVVASEAITVGNNTITLPGIGAFLAEAIAQRNLAAVGWVILAMTIVILAYDQLMFRPLVAWADKFRMETTSSGVAPESWFLDLVRRTRLIHQLLVPAGWLCAMLARVPLRLPSAQGAGLARSAGGRKRASSLGGDIAWALVLLVAAVYVIWRVVAYVRTGVSADEVGHVFVLGFITLARRRTHHDFVAALGAARRADRPAAGVGRESPAARAVPRCISRQSAFSRVRARDCALSPHAGHLALAAHRARDAVVYPLQRDRRGERLSERFPRSGREFPHSRLAVVAAGHAARHFSLLRDRCDYRLGRRMEREHRLGSRSVGRYPCCRARPRGLHRADHRGRGFPEDHSRHRRDVAVRHAVQPYAVAAALCLCGSEAPAQLMLRSVRWPIQE
jgi:ABC-type anion transport system duplicated permease subunit